MKYSQAKSENEAYSLFFVQKIKHYFYMGVTKQQFFFYLLIIE